MIELGALALRVPAQEKVIRHRCEPQAVRAVETGIVEERHGFDHLVCCRADLVPFGQGQRGRTFSTEKPGGILDPGKDDPVFFSCTCHRGAGNRVQVQDRFFFACCKIPLVEEERAGQQVHRDDRADGYPVSDLAVTERYDLEPEPERAFDTDQSPAGELALCRFYHRCVEQFPGCGTDRGVRTSQVIIFHVLFLLGLF